MHSLFEKWVRRKQRSVNAGAGRRRPISTSRRRLSLEVLERRELLAINFVFVQLGDFIDKEKLAVLNHAAAQITSRLDNHLAAIPAPPEGKHQWTAHVADPRTGAIQLITDQFIPANTLVVLVGGRPDNFADQGALAQTCDQFGSGECTIKKASGVDAATWNTIRYRGQKALSTWGGSIAFNSSFTWHVALPDGPTPPRGQVDFYTVALHELGHLLGFSRQNPEAEALVEREGTIREFVGENVKRFRGHPERVHYNGGLHWDYDIAPVGGRKPSMWVPRRGSTLWFEQYHQRVFTTLDFLALKDLGWQVDKLGSGDYDGDLKADLSVWRSSTSRWYSFESTSSAPRWGRAGDVPLNGDFSGDGFADVAVWRPSNGGWYVHGHGTYRWGISTDIPVPGDYDGNGVTDVAVWRPSNGTWYVQGQFTQRWGAANGFPNPADFDVPAPADYDGDGKVDLAVFRNSTRSWRIRYSSGKSPTATYWGAPGDLPVPADYDGDGQDDIAVWRNSNRTWYIIGSRDGQKRVQRWGAQGDIPQPADYDGDGRTDIAVWRPSTGYWHIIQSQNNQVVSRRWGISGDTPVANAYVAHLAARYAASPVADAAQTTPTATLQIVASQASSLTAEGEPTWTDQNRPITHQQENALSSKPNSLASASSDSLPSSEKPWTSNRKFLNRGETERAGVTDEIFASEEEWRILSFTEDMQTRLATTRH